MYTADTTINFVVNNLKWKCNENSDRGNNRGRCNLFR